MCRHFACVGTYLVPRFGAGTARGRAKVFVSPERVRARLEEAGGVEFAQLGDAAAFAALGALAIVDPATLDGRSDCGEELPPAA